MNNWLVQTLRLTLFTADSAPGITDLWDALVNEVPEINESRPREGYQRLATAKEEYQVELHAFPGRVDYLLVPPLDGGIPPNINIGPIDARLPNFAKEIESYINHNLKFDVVRIALGIVVMQPTQSREEAYKFLSKRLDFALDPTKSKEFMLQINYPYIFKRKDGTELELNHLIKWSAARFNRFTLSSPHINKVPSVITEDFVRLEIDNSSTAEEVQPYSIGELSEIFDQLVNLAQSDLGSNQ